MNIGEIWWGQLGNSIRFLTSLSDAMRDNRSTVLQLPAFLPWRSDFYDAVDARRGISERRLKRLVWNDQMTPGAFVLDQLCPPETQANYWPGQSYAAYLSEQRELILNDYYVWITGVHSRSAMEQWIQFLSEYSECVTDAFAVFYIEYDGPAVNTDKVEKLAYRSEHYDCRVFCLEMAAALSNTDLPDYQAELALRIGGGEPELCAALLERGEPLLRDPVWTTLETISSVKTAEGFPFPPMTEEQISSAAWEAEIVEIFPVLESYRMDFIARHKSDLISCLPINNTIGGQIHQVTEPQDLEFGTLYYMMSQHSGFSAAEGKTIALCREIRNALAHNSLVPLNSIRKLLALQH